MTQAKRFLEQNLGADCLYDSAQIPVGASTRPMSDGDFAIQTRTVQSKYKNIVAELMDTVGDRDASRASLAVLCLTVGSSVSSILLSNPAVFPAPEIIRFTVVWLLSFAPLIFVGYGIADAEQLQGVLTTIQRRLFPSFRQRMLQHEAGHLLMGHLLGWPVKGYQVKTARNAVELYPLADKDRASDRASRLGFDAGPVQEDPLFSLVKDVPFFSDEGRGSGELGNSVFRNRTAVAPLSPEQDPSTVWPFQAMDDKTLDKLTIISVAGVCAELLAYGNAQGGAADFAQLTQYFGEMDERESNNRIRYAVAYTLTQLRRNLGVLDELVIAMDRGGSMGECVSVMESCEQRAGPPEMLLMGSDVYELERRKKFRQESVIEPILLGDSGRGMDDKEDRVKEGKGGGYRDERTGIIPALTDDDPFYFAIFTSLAFLAWASAGGLSLH